LDNKRENEKDTYGNNSTIIGDYTGRGKTCIFYFLKHYLGWIA
jgi:hypothetical protein